MGLSNPVGKSALHFVNYRSGYHTQNSITGAEWGPVGFVANDLIATPYNPSTSYSCDNIVLSVNAAAGNAAIGVYGSDSNNNPATLITQSGSIAVAGAGNLSFPITISFSAFAYYWIAVHCSAAPVFAGTDGVMISSNLSNLKQTAALSSVPYTGTLPSTFPAWTPVIGPGCFARMHMV